jgi:hypothetical protein
MCGKGVLRLRVVAAMEMERAEMSGSEKQTSSAALLRIRIVRAIIGSMGDAAMA